MKSQSRVLLSGVLPIALSACGGTPAQNGESAAATANVATAAAADLSTECGAESVYLEVARQIQEHMWPNFPPGQPHPYLGNAQQVRELLTFSHPVAEQRTPNSVRCTAEILTVVSPMAAFQDFPSVKAKVSGERMSMLIRFDALRDLNGELVVRLENAPALAEVIGFGFLTSEQGTKAVEALRASLPPARESESENGSDDNMTDAAKQGSER